MTAGPTPVPPAVLAGDGRADALPPRARLRRALRARAGAPAAASSAPQNHVLRSRPAARARWSRPSPTSSAPARRRSPARRASSASAGSSSCEAYGADLVRYEPGWGVRLDPAEIDRLLGENPGVEVVFATLCETSTGIVHDVQAIAEVVRRARRAARRRRGLGPRRRRLEQDAWGVDVVVAGSQKALMTPPGLAFASVSQRALDAAAAQAGGRYYFDWAGRPRARQGRRARSRPRCRSSSALDVALGHDRGGGARGRVGAPRRCSPAPPAPARSRSGSTSTATPTSARRSSPRSSCPDDVDGGKVPGALRKLGITANGGQDRLKGRILRIAHCGYFGAFDILTSLSGLEMALRSSATRSSTAPASARPRGSSSRPACSAAA